MTGGRVLLVGGTSEIGLAIVRRMASERLVQPYLLGRDRERLEAALASIPGPGAVGVVEGGDLEAHEEAVRTAFERFGGFDAVIVAIGLLGAQAGLDADPDESVDVMGVNFLGAGLLMLHSLRRLRDSGGGVLVVLSSVAAERPRASNAIYGAAKAGLDALAQGLGDSCAGSGVRVLVVRPGFVRTRMTAGLKPAPFATTPEAVAEATVKALGSRAHTIWVPASLRLVFGALRLLPRPIWRKLPL